MPQVVVYHHPNSQIKSFITSIDISAFKVEYFRNPLGKDSREALKGLGIIGESVVKEIMTIPGVEEIYIKPNEVRLKKIPSFSWEKINEKTIVILNRALRKKEMRIIKKDKSKPHTIED